MNRWRDRVPQPVRIVTVYVAISLLWILFSDAALSALIKDPGVIQVVATLKGWFFVALTAALLYSLLEADRRRLAASDAERRAVEMRTVRMLEAMPDAVAFFSSDGTVTYANRAAREFAARVGADLSTDLLAARDWRFCDGMGKAVTVDELPAVRLARAGTLVNGDVLSFEGADGARVWLSVSVVPSENDLGMGSGALVTAADITDRMRASQRLERLNRLYTVLGEASRVLVALPDSPDVLHEVCRIVTGVGGFRMAWVGLVDEATSLVRPVATAGFVDGYLDGVVVSSKDVPEGRGPIGKAIRSGRPHVSNDFTADPDMAPWLERALSRGYRAAAAFPLRAEDKTVGALMVYASSTGQFGREEVALLERLASYVSFALDFERIVKMRADTELRLSTRVEELFALNEGLQRTIEDLRADSTKHDSPGTDTERKDES